MMPGDDGFIRIRCCSGCGGSVPTSGQRCSSCFGDAVWENVENRGTILSCVSGRGEYLVAAEFPRGGRILVAYHGSEKPAVGSEIRLLFPSGDAGDAVAVPY